MCIGVTFETAQRHLGGFAFNTAPYHSNHLHLFGQLLVGLKIEILDFCPPMSRMHYPMMAEKPSPTSDKNCHQ